MLQDSRRSKFQDDERLTATSQVVATPELLHLICGYCTPIQNRHNALVSKTWSNEALGVLWYELDSLAPLLGLLAPLKLVDKKIYKFDRHTRPGDWAIFHKYSWRVHTIDANEQSADFDTSVFVDIAVSRPASDFLPNLSRLAYPDDLSSFQFIPLFMSPSLVHLNLSLMSDETYEAICEEILSYVPEKAPNLEHIVLQASSAVDTETVDSLRLDVLFSSLSRLKTVVIAPTFFVPSAIHGLGHLQGLRSLTIPFDGNNPPKPLNLTTPSNTFSSLTNFLTEWNSFHDIISFLDVYNPPALRSLSVASHEAEVAEMFARLLEVTLSGRPYLEEISLSALRCNTVISEPSVSADFFHVLHGGTNLTSLVLCDTPPLSLSIRTVCDLLKALPSLQKLRLLEYPTAPPTFPLSGLSELAPLCPRLEELALYMETSQVQGVSVPHRNASECFQRLRCLSVGTSPLDSPALEVTAFLSSILPKWCCLARGWDHHLPIDERQAKYDAWKSVVDSLSTMV
ncbi:F-box domain-containing protein [Pleurotus pulmonarius]